MKRKRQKCDPPPKGYSIHNNVSKFNEKVDKRNDYQNQTKSNNISNKLVAMATFFGLSRLDDNCEQIPLPASPILETDETFVDSNSSNDTSLENNSENNNSSTLNSNNISSTTKNNSVNPAPSTSKANNIPPSHPKPKKNLKTVLKNYRAPIIDTPCYIIFVFIITRLFGRFCMSHVYILMK